MRPIRFRAFDKNGDGMFYDIQNGITFDDGSRYTFDRFLNKSIDDVHDWVVTQFTGLKDIYEGDILKYTYDGDDLNAEYFEVRFINGAFYAGRDEDWELLSGDLDLEKDGTFTITVAGNIYQNKELLLLR